MVPPGADCICGRYSIVEFPFQRFSVELAGMYTKVTELFMIIFNGEGD